MERRLKQLISPFASILLAFAVGSFIIMAIGENPLEVFQLLINGAFGSKTNVGETLLKSTTLMLTGLSYAFAYRCGLINIGAEGQLFMGALFSAIGGIYIKGLPMIIHIPIVLIMAVIGGGIWGLIAGWLKNRFGANEIITTVMMNYIAIYLVGYMVSGPLKEPSGNQPQSAVIEATAKLPRILDGTRLNIGFIIAIICLIVYYIFLWHSSKGYELRVVGKSQEAAKYAGVNVKKNVVLSMFISGGIAGLAGAVEVLGVQYRLFASVSSGVGFDGIAVALLGANSPIGIFFSSILFGAMRSGGNAVQMFSNVPSSIINIIQALVVLFVVSGIVMKIGKKRKLKGGE